MDNVILGKNNVERVNRRFVFDMKQHGFIIPLQDPIDVREAISDHLYDVIYNDPRRRLGVMPGMLKRALMGDWINNPISILEINKTAPPKRDIVELRDEVNERALAEMVRQGTYYANGIMRYYKELNRDYTDIMGRIRKYPPKVIKRRKPMIENKLRRLFISTDDYKKNGINIS
jgi:hypothetical protein